MAKFIVSRGRDAWAIEEAIVEAASAEEAERWAVWNSNARTLDWKPTGEVRTFDDTEIMEGETRPYTPEDVPEAHRILHVTEAEHATILAALRYYQQQGLGDPVFRTDAIHDIATNGDTVVSLDADAIDTLCERIN